MKLSEIYKTMVFDDRVFLDAKTLIMNIEELEEQIDKMKLCDNCKYQNMDDGMFCRVIHKDKKEWCFKVGHPRWELKE